MVNIIDSCCVVSSTRSIEQAERKTMAEKVLLKKYPNRRLYDTEKSTYVTLGQVADMIRQGRQIEVVDAKTQVDVTAFILTQIILEQAKRQNSLLPVSFLHLVIRYGENVLSEFFEKYLELTVQNYLTYKTAADEQFRKWLELGMDLSFQAQRTMTDLTPLKSLFESLSDSENDPDGESTTQRDD
jgi:polyhydroxyalkanoate synthesis repressor PhaR